jgi:glycerate 2-kinase
MKIVVAPDSFKGNLTSIQVADYVEAGILKADAAIEVVKVPVADGGEGSVEAMIAAAGGTIVPVKVCGPLGETVDAFYGLLADGRTAVIEMAAAAGLHLVPEDKKNPMETTTWGVGQLLLEALNQGVQRVIMCIGGSSTNDAGTGMVQALGGKFFDKAGMELGRGGKMLSAIDRIDISGIDARIAKTTFIAACDVKNPLFGPSGAAYVYAPQKGATPEMVTQLDKGLEQFAEAVHQSLGIEVSNISGGGAAGGLGAGLVAFCGARLMPGIDVVIEATAFEEKLQGADMLITGEGRTDGQTAYGKVPVGLAMVAKRCGVPVVCLSGGLAGDYENIYAHGIDAAFSNVTDAMPLKEAMLHSGDMMTKAAYAITRLMLALRKKC